MRYLSLFSGIEAASCAWQPLGWELKGVCEIEKFPCNVLKHHYPEVPNLGDITKFTREQLEALGPIDLIVGGSPCLAGDVEVLTNHGWKPIIRITADDKLWDGDHYVSHCGVIYKGIKQVMRVDGIYMTPNHLLYYPEHNTWREAGEWFTEDSDDDRIAMAMMEDTWSYLPADYKYHEYLARGRKIRVVRDTAKCIEVYDILDVGPHNRFMIRTENGILLAHNCQGFSVAGKQEGLNDIRSKLAIDYIRVINTVKPRWIVWENVPGVLSTNKGMDFRYFTEVLTHYGYGICWRILDGQWFGVAQRRRRVFLVGYLGDWRPAYKVLFESQSLPRYFETLKRKGESLARASKTGTGKAGTTCLNPWSEQSKRVLDINGKSDCLCASEKMRSITKIFDDRGTAACMGYGKYVETEKAETLRASGGDLGAGSENICYDMNHPCDVIRTYDDGKTPTLEARMGTGGNNIPLVHDKTLFLERQYFATHEGKASTLTRDIYRDPPAVLKDEKEPLCCDVGWLQTYENKAPTQLARQFKDPPIVLNEAYRIGSYYSNSMQSDNPNSGIYQTDKSATLQTADPSPACQQGGIAVVQGSVIGRKTENGPMGSGINMDKCFTLNATDRHAVCAQARVRKLTPTECLRLQGFPDDWFEGVPGYSDTAAYKAIGNSMCVNAMLWLGERIAAVESEL